MNPFHAYSSLDSRPTSEADVSANKEFPPKPTLLPRRPRIVLCVFPALFGLATTVPLYAQEALTLPLWFLAFLGLTLFCFICMRFAFTSLRWPEEEPPSVTATETAVAPSLSLASDKRGVRRIFWISFALFELVFLFALLSNYPGLCSPDSHAIIAQVTGIEYFSDSNRYEGLTNAHPIFYTFLVWIVFTSTSFLGSETFSLFVFIFLQMSYVAAVLAWAVSWLARKGARRGYLIFSLAFIALSPVISSHVIVLWKDVPFAATLLILVLQLSELHAQRTPTRKQLIALGATMLVVSLFRNNGYYAVLLSVIFLVLFYPRARKQFVAIGASLVLFFVVPQGPIFGLLSIAPGHFAESVGIPLQQLAATLRDGGEISADDEEFLGSILPIEEWKTSYDPSSSNPLKQHELFNDDYLDSHKGDFLRVWAHCLPLNIKTYLRAWVLETYGYWQPGYTTDVGRLTYTIGDVPSSDLLGLGYRPHIIANSLNKLFPHLLGMGSLLWISALFLAWGLARTKGKSRTLSVIAPFIPLIGLMGTLFVAAPIVNDYRYIFVLYLIIPFLPQIHFWSVRKPDEGKESPQKQVPSEQPPNGRSETVRQRQ